MPSFFTGKATVELRLEGVCKIWAHPKNYLNAHTVFAFLNQSISSQAISIPTCLSSHLNVNPVINPLLMPLTFPVIGIHVKGNRYKRRQIICDCPPRNESCCIIWSFWNMYLSYSKFSALFIGENHLKIGLMVEKIGAFDWQQPQTNLTENQTWRHVVTTVRFSWFWQQASLISCTTCSLRFF